MKKILIFLFFVSSYCFANDYVYVKEEKQYEYHNHKLYESWYDVEKKNPAFVIWDLSHDWVIEVERKSIRPNSHFQQCLSAPNSLRNYRKSGYDQGHLCPNADMDFDKETSFMTFRACNICPQTPELNRGSWKKWEDKGRKFAKVHGLVTIIAGPIYDNIYETIGQDNVAVPSGFFKIFLIDKKFKVLIFNQKNEPPKEIDIKELEKLTKLHFVIK